MGKYCRLGESFALFYLASTATFPAHYSIISHTYLHGLKIRNRRLLESFSEGEIESKILFKMNKALIAICLITKHMAVIRNTNSSFN